MHEKLLRNCEKSSRIIITKNLEWQRKNTCFLKISAQQIFRLSLGLLCSISTINYTIFSFWGHTVAPLCHNQPHDHQKFTTTMNNFTSELQEEEEEKEKPQKHSNHIGVISSLNTTCCKTRNSWIDDTYRSHSPPPLKFHPLNLYRKKNHTHFNGKA